MFSSPSKIRVIIAGCMSVERFSESIGSSPAARRTEIYSFVA